MSDSDIARYGRKFMQFFWDPLPRNEDTSGAPIFCLGVRYDGNPVPNPSESSPLPIPSAPDTSISQSYDTLSDLEERPTSGAEPPAQHQQDAVNEAREDDGGWPAAFLDDFESRVWFTYRSGFPSIPKSHDPKASSALTLAVRIRNQLANQEGFTSDTGWGCMIRSGQSLLANALLLSELGRDWRRKPQGLEERKLISPFADDPRAPFSIHNFVEHGASACGKHPGEWFGPSATARCIQALANQHTKTNIAVYITGDGSDVYEEGVFKIAKAKTGIFQPTLILVGTRLGLDRITPVYWEALRATLQMPQSVGIAGGRPSSSHYFIGTQGSDFFYLDPHQTRPALPLRKDPKDYTEEEIGSCHTRRLRRINVREMDPSMLIGFLVRNEAEWHTWRQHVSEFPGKAIIHVMDKEPPQAGSSTERESAIDEVETFDTEDDEM